MKIKITRSFQRKLNKQIAYISKDKPQAARSFKFQIQEGIREVSNRSFSCRMSIFFERDDIRDLIIKGYVVVYKIDKKKDTIEVFGFTKWEDDHF